MLPAGQNSPPSHCKQALTEEEPDSALYVPPAQGVGCAALAGQKLPGGHTRTEELPLGQYDPAVHGAHVCAELAPVAALNVPPGHWAQMSAEDAPAAPL
jgi:hypothetical protein